MDNILSCRPGSFGKFAGQAYPELQKLGVRYVEADMPKPGQEAALKAELAKYGLAAMTLGGSFDVKDAKCVEAFKPQLASAVTLGVKRIFLSVNRGELEPKLAYDRLRALGELLKPAGVFAVMETHPNMVTNGDVGRQTMEGVNHPNIRINFDTANIYYYNEKIDGCTEMAKVLPFIEAIHLKDTDGSFHGWAFCEFGKGVVDFKKTFQMLNARGFYGPFTTEIEGCQGEDLNFEQTVARVRNSLAHLRKLGCTK